MEEHINPVYLDAEEFLEIVKQIALNQVRENYSPAFPKAHVEDVNVQQLVVSQTVAATLEQLRDLGYRLVK